MHAHETSSRQSDSAADGIIDTSSHSGLRVHTVDLLNLLSTGFPDVAVGYDRQRHLMLLKTIPHLVFACFSFVK